MHEKVLLSLGAGGIVAGVVAVGLFRPTPVVTERSVRAPGPPVTLDDPVEEELLRKLSQAEGLLRLGKTDAAAALARELPPRGPHAAAALRVRCWAHFLAREYADVVDLLHADRLDSELAFLRGASYWRSGLEQEGLGKLRTLWWGEPDGVWGLAALRELADPPPEANPVYSAEERTAIAAALPQVSVDAARSAEGTAARHLETLRKTTHGQGVLATEVKYAIGVRALRSEKFTEAVRVLRAALADAANPDLRRVVGLRLGESERHRGGYAAAQAHFARVAAAGNDRFADEALALAGQTAIEYRRYAEARQHFQAQLVTNPIGPARHDALWGLGWVAFRTGDFTAARRFFDTLLTEAPFGPLAPRALYWRARTLEERGQRHVAAAQMAALEKRFPVDYYAYRARVWRDDESPATPAALPSPRAERRVAHVRGLVESGMLRRARRALQRIGQSTADLGPEDLTALAALSGEAGDERSAHRFRRALHRRYPGSREAIDILAARFPPAYVRMLAHQAREQRIDPLLAPALVLQESGFRARAVSPVGALGLMQLMPSTARMLLHEESRRAAATTEVILDPATNIRLGVRYLARMLRAFDRRVEYALAAYNAGPGAVTRWRQARGDLPVDIFVEEIPYRETQQYARRVLAASQTLWLVRNVRRDAAGTELARAKSK